MNTTISLFEAWCCIACMFAGSIALVWIGIFSLTLLCRAFNWVSNRWAQSVLSMKLWKAAFKEYRDNHPEAFVKYDEVTSRINEEDSQ